MDLDIFDTLNIVGNGDLGPDLSFSNNIQGLVPNSPKASDEDQIYNVIGLDKLFESTTTDIDDSYDFSEIQDIKDFSSDQNFMELDLQDKVNLTTDNVPQSLNPFQGEFCTTINSIIGDHCSDQMGHSADNTQSKQEIPDFSELLTKENESFIKKESVATIKSCDLKLPLFTQKDFRAITGKNPRSGYLIFCSEIRKSIASQNPGVSFSDIGKAMGVEWNKLSEKQKQIYQEQAQEINLQIMNAAQSQPKRENKIVNLSATLSKKERSNNNVHRSNSKPQIQNKMGNCPKNGFFFYCEEMRHTILARHPKAKPEDAEELLYLLKKEWTKLRKELRLPFELKAKHNNSIAMQNCIEEKQLLKSSKKSSLSNFKAMTGQNQKTGYLMFCSEIRKRITENNPGVSFSDLGKAMGVEWNQLSERKKLDYQDKAREINLQIIKDSLDKPKIEQIKVSKKCPSKPSKSGFSVFATEYRKEMKMRYPNYNRREISQLVSNEWKKLGSDEKLRYVHQAAAVNLVEESAKTANGFYKDEPVEVDLNISCQFISSENSNSINPLAASTTQKSVFEKKGKKCKSLSTNENVSKRGRSNGYQLYCIERHKRVKEEMPDASFGDICRFVGNEWKGLSASIRKEYQDKANLKNMETITKKEIHIKIDEYPLNDERKRNMCSTPVSAACIPKQDPSKFNKLNLTTSSALISSPATYNARPLKPVYSQIIPAMHWSQSKQVIQAPGDLPKSFSQTYIIVPKSWSQVQQVNQIVVKPSNADVMANVVQQPAAPASVMDIPKLKIISKEKLMSYKIYNPLSAYQYFFVEMQKKVNSKNPHISFDKVSQLIDLQWNHLSESERKVLHDRVDQIRSEIDVAKQFYTRDSKTPDSTSQHDSEMESLDRQDSPAEIKDEHCSPKYTEDFLDEFDSLEEYFDKLQSPESLRNCQPSDSEIQLETPESIYKAIHHDSPQLCKNLNLTEQLETPKSKGAEYDSVDVFDTMNTSLHSSHSQFNITETSMSSELSVNFENFKAAVEGKSFFDTTEVSDVFIANPKKKKKESLPKSCPKFAYQTFFNEMEKNLKITNPHASFDDLSKLIDKEWMRLKKSDKKVLKTQARRSLKLAKEKQKELFEVDINNSSHSKFIKNEHSINLKSPDSPHLQSLLSSPVKEEFDAKFSLDPNKSSVIKREPVLDKKFNIPKKKLQFEEVSQKSLDFKKAFIKSPKRNNSPYKTPKERNYLSKVQRERKYVEKLEFSPLRSPRTLNESLNESFDCDTSFGWNDDPFDFRAKANYLFNFMMAFEEDGRKPITLFIQLPSEEKWPDYYKTVKHPMDMKTIEGKLKSNHYKNIKEVIRDLRLMFKNCQEFHKKASQIYKDSIMLKQILNKAFREYKPNLELSPNHLNFESSNEATKSLNLKKIKSFYYSIKNFKAKSKIFSRFHFKPISEELNPRYYEIIKEVVDFDLISQRVIDGKYFFLSEIFGDVKKLYLNACQYYEPESQIYRAALNLQRFAFQKYSELIYDLKPTLDSVQELLFIIFVSTFNYKNSKGKYLSDSISKIPGFEWVNGEWTRVETLESIKMRLDKGQYNRLDDLQEHLFSVFARARRFRELHDELYEDSVQLQRKYISVRDQLCGHGTILKAQALNYKIRDFTYKLQMEKLEHDPKSEDKQLVSSCGNIHSSFTKAAEVSFCVGDYIYVNPLGSESIVDCLIMEIETLWTDSLGLEMVYGCQYFKPQDINLLLGDIPEQTSVDETPSMDFSLTYCSLRFQHQEIIKSDKYLSLPFSKVIGKCVILNLDAYSKFTIANFHGQDVYSCQYFYSVPSHNLKKLDLTNCVSTPKYATISERTETEQVDSLLSLYELKVEKRQNQFEKLQNETDKDLKPKIEQNIERKDEATEDNAVYIQYQSNIGSLRMGDFVYIQTDVNSAKFVLHIHRIIVEKGGLEYLIGTKYIIQEKEPGKKTYGSIFTKEVYFFSFRETYAMAHVMGKCMVMDLKDYMTLRPTDIPETDVYFCEFSFDKKSQCLCPNNFIIPKYKFSEEISQMETYCLPTVISLKKVKRIHFVNGKHLDVHYLPDEDKLSSKHTLQFIPGCLENVSSSNLLSKMDEAKTKFRFNNYYLYFQNERFKALRKDYPEYTHTELYSMAAKEWKTLSEEEKMFYQKQMKEKAAMFSLQTYEAEDEYVDSDGRKSYRLAHSKVIQQMNKDAFCLEEGGVIDNFKRSLLSWLKKQKDLKKVVTFKDLKEQAFHLYRIMKLPAPLMPHLAKFKAEFRNEIIKERLLRDGRGRPPLYNENKRRKIATCATEAKLSLQRKVDLPLLKEFNIVDCRVPVTPLELYELSSRDRKLLLKRRSNMFKRKKRVKNVKIVKHKPKIRHCKKCNIGFSNKMSLDKHMRSEHKESNQCQMCGKAFLRNIDLRCHIAWHGKMHKYYYFCQVCDKYLKKDKLESHLSQHAKENVNLIIVNNHQLQKVEVDSDSSKQDQIGSIEKCDLGQMPKHEEGKATSNTSVQQKTSAIESEEKTNLSPLDPCKLVGKSDVSSCPDKSETSRQSNQEALVASLPDNVQNSDEFISCTSFTDNFSRSMPENFDELTNHLDTEILATNLQSSMESVNGSVLNSSDMNSNNTHNVAFSPLDPNIAIEPIIKNVCDANHDKSLNEVVGPLTKRLKTDESALVKETTNDKVSSDQFTTSNDSLNEGYTSEDSEFRDKLDESSTQLKNIDNL